MNLCNLLVMRGREAANNLGGLAPKTLLNNVSVSCVLCNNSTNVKCCLNDQVHRES